jgi:hypothetical protein
MKIYHNPKANQRHISHFPPKTWSPGQPFLSHNYKPGDSLPPSHIRVDAMERLRRFGEAYEVYLRDEAARMDRAGRRAA